MNIRDSVINKLNPTGRFTVLVARNGAVEIRCLDGDVPAVTGEQSLRDLVQRVFPGCQVIRSNTFKRQKLNNSSMAKFARTGDPRSFEQSEYEVVIFIPGCGRG